MITVLDEHRFFFQKSVIFFVLMLLFESTLVTNVSRLGRKPEQTPLLVSASHCITNNASGNSDFDGRMLDAVRYNRACPSRGTINVFVNSL